MEVTLFNCCAPFFRLLLKTGLSFSAGLTLWRDCREVCDCWLTPSRCALPAADSATPLMSLPRRWALRGCFLSSFTSPPVGTVKVAAPPRFYGTESAAGKTRLECLSAARAYMIYIFGLPLHGSLMTGPDSCVCAYLLALPPSLPSSLSNELRLCDEVTPELSSPLFCVTDTLIDRDP